MVNEDNLILETKEINDQLGKGSSGESITVKKPSGKEEDLGFKELYEKSLQNVQLGEIVTGKVVQINNDVIMVDVGWKTEGYIPARELKDDKGDIAVGVGDEIEVLVDKRDSDGNLVLSRDKAAKIKVWDDVKNAYEKNSIPFSGSRVPGRGHGEGIL